MKLPKAEHDWKVIKQQPIGLSLKQLHEYSKEQ